MLENTLFPPEVNVQMGLKTVGLRVVLRGVPSRLCHRFTRAGARLAGGSKSRCSHRHSPCRTTRAKIGDGCDIDQRPLLAGTKGTRGASSMRGPGRVWGVGVPHTTCSCKSMYARLSCIHAFQP